MNYPYFSCVLKHLKEKNDFDIRQLEEEKQTTSPPLRFLLSVTFRIILLNNFFHFLSFNNSILKTN